MPTLCPTVDGKTLRKVMNEQVNMAASTLWTDEGSWYEKLGEEFVAHNTVNHSEEEYVDKVTGATTNHAEGYFSQLKRSIDGTHHHVSREHLPRYLTHFDFLYSTSDLTDRGRMARLVNGTEGRGSATSESGVIRFLSLPLIPKRFILR